MAKKIVYNNEEIIAMLPHRPPFLFVDYVTKFKENRYIEAERLLHEEEFYFQGHFPNMPIMPGVLIADALAQTSGLLWGFSTKKSLESQGEKEPEAQLFFLAAANIKFTHPAYPGDTLQLIAQREKNFGDLHMFAVEAIVKTSLVAKGTLTLAMRTGDV